MFKKMYYYHVSFHLLSNGKSTVGSVVHMRDSKIKKADDVEQVRERIKIDMQTNNIVILNWIRLKGV